MTSIEKQKDFYFFTYNFDCYTYIKIKIIKNCPHKTNISNFGKSICTSVDKYESRILQTKNTIFSPTFYDINQQQSKVKNCDANLSERISSLVILTYDANTLKQLLKTKIYKINGIENV